MVAGEKPRQARTKRPKRGFVGQSLTLRVRILRVLGRGGFSMLSEQKSARWSCAAQEVSVTLSAIDLIIGSGMLAVGLAAITFSVLSYRRTGTGRDTAAEDNLLLGVGASCLGLLVFLLGLLGVLFGGPG